MSQAKDLLLDAALREAADRSPLHQDLARRAKRLKLGDAVYFVVEGDLLLDADELAVYALRREHPEWEHDFSEHPSRKGLRLIGMTDDVGLVKWPKSQVLSYCVERESFGDSAGRYQATVANVREAATNWQSVCDVCFSYDGSKDKVDADRSQCVFRVRQEALGENLLALAFYPNTEAPRRVLRLDPSYFGEHDFSPVGILRHELGHVLGFRHEHISSGAPPVCPDEPMGGTLELTAYDPQSVMHYFCVGGRIGSKTMQLSAKDIQGAQKLYGPPKSS